ncbi:hypothetical protein [Collimonas sp.]|uniref:hypothetical protein n=1 Tax=Collimonas sp. TaxID=1963772 RepID=UPI002C5417A7|nr:hypothetical protein [Collimonas sp.]HWW07924.1 hypothetical protein [Collimonas sp.]
MSEKCRAMFFTLIAISAAIAAHSAQPICGARNWCCAPLKKGLFGAAVRVTSAMCSAMRGAMHHEDHLIYLLTYLLTYLFLQLLTGPAR